MKKIVKSLMVSIILVIGLSTIGVNDVKSYADDIVTDYSSIGVDITSETYESNTSFNTFNKLDGLVSYKKAKKNDTSTTSDTYVWISETGSKYHSKNNCGRMNPNKATQMSLSDAKASGYGKCKKCW